MIKIVPSIMCADSLNLQNELQRLEASGVDMLHCDIMDGQYVDNLAMGFYVLEAIKKATTIPLDVHLAVMEPERYLEKLSRIGVEIVSVHVERVKCLHRTVHYIRELGMKASIALNPNTPSMMVKHIINYVDMLLIMTVDPGFEGQKFIPEMLDKIREIRQYAKDHDRDILIEIDGNINEKTIPNAVKAGADTLVLGTSALFKRDIADYRAPISEIRTLAESCITKR